jgi:CheY-like chemotaxis protein/HPt (histidine-containing phosphotransfer) domain-containing protein
LFDALSSMLTRPGAIKTLAEETAPERGASGYVLVVDDNAVNRKVAVSLLQNLGYRADTANDGIEALTKVGDGHYDAVLMDCQMPRMDGYQATAAIRNLAVGGSIPIVAVTASAMSSDRDRCLDAGMDDFITKPIDRATMARIIRDCIAGRVRTEAPALPGLLESAAIDGSVTAGLLDIDSSGELLRELIVSFRETVDARTAELADAARFHHFSAVAALAHEFKGAAASLGLFTLAGVYNRLEQLALGNDPTVESTIDELIREVGIAVRGLELLSSPAELVIE